MDPVIFLWEYIFTLHFKTSNINLRIVPLKSQLIKNSHLNERIKQKKKEHKHSILTRGKRVINTGMEI